MTQDERWLERYTEVKDFIESNHRNPSRHNSVERFRALSLRRPLYFAA